ncbi:MAG: TRAP transporter small permease [Rhodobacterales bacterium]
MPEDSSAYDMTKEALMPDTKPSFYERSDLIVTRVESFVMIAAYSVLMAIIGFETLRRVFFQSNWLAGPDVALYAFVWLAWFAMAHNIHNDTHLSFTEFRERMPLKLRRAFEIFDCLLWIGAGIIVIYTTWGLIERQLMFNQKIFGTSIPVAVGSLAVPAGWGFSMLRILQRLYRIIWRHEDFHADHVVRELV